MERKTIGLLGLLFAATVLFSGFAEANETSCTRKFDDQAIQRLVELAIQQYSLNVDRPYRIEVNWSKCKYFIVIWRTDPPPAPGSQVLLTLDDQGRVEKVP